MKQIIISLVCEQQLWLSTLVVESIAKAGVDGVLGKILLLAVVAEVLDAVYGQHFVFGSSPDIDLANIVLRLGCKPCDKVLQI